MQLIVARNITTLAPSAIGFLAGQVCEIVAARIERKVQRIVPAKQRDSAMKACFHNLAGLNNQPLSERAHRRAIKVLLQLKRCLHGFGIKVGKPIVQNMSFGRAKFGFEGSGSRPANQTRAETTRVDHLCERRVDMAQKISRIIAEDRRRAHAGGF